MNTICSCGVKAIPNRHYTPSTPPEFLRESAVLPVLRLHQGMEGYAPTPLVRLDGLAKALNVKDILIKDESQRFGLKAFKGLGGLYALTRIACRQLQLNPETVTFKKLQSEAYAAKLKEMVFVTATDGNHGKGIAWAAGLLGCRAHVYMPKGSTQARAQAIREAGKAEVTVTDLGYDDTVKFAASIAVKNGWHLVQDTSWDGYEEIPTWIIQGYTTMAAEAAEQLKRQGIAAPTHVFLQAGVGAMAGSMTGYLANRYREAPPAFITAEPEDMACIYTSIQSGDGAAHAVDGDSSTIVAGLNCGEPCTVAWPVLRNFVSWSTACSDRVAALGMRILAAPLSNDPPVTSGESGAITTGLLALLASRDDLKDVRDRMGLNADSVILLFNTEGDTDPQRYQEIVYGGRYSF